MRFLDLQTSWSPNAASQIKNKNELKVNAVNCLFQRLRKSYYRALNSWQLVLRFPTDDRIWRKGKRKTQNKR